MRVKSITLLCLVALCSLSAMAGNKPKPMSQHAEKGAFFRENKGQVKDQNWMPRPDVLFSGESNGLTYHLKKDGLHYQLSKVETWKDETEARSMPGMDKEARKVPDQISLYRVDVSWVGANPFCEIVTGEAKPDYENFYNVPEGVEPALFVKSYASVTYKNLYDNIDLKFYQTQRGELEYDFVVHPGGDYKKIQLDIQGSTLSLNNQQELVLTTPLGTITEGALHVHQAGKTVPAGWVLNSATKVSYQIENFDPEADLTIDPPVRLWGTYYGGSDSDGGYSCATDANGNVYLAGCTESTSAIATTGAHQTTIDSSGYSAMDAFLVKFDSAGTRLWGTYYGGSNLDYGYSCTIDATGNVYLAGLTYSITAISTTGAHQTTFGSNTTNYQDAFLVKFDSSGTRLWGTYYGGNFDDSGYSCATDANGNVFLVGMTYSGNAIATTGAHQTTINAGNFGFLVKFNASGTRLWGTYYGHSYSCATDLSGNVYLAGWTESTTAIATSGAHQTTYGGKRDAFLVKFDSSGIRIWGTYYGGDALDEGYSCTTDAADNVYLTGRTRSKNGIAGTSAHQITRGPLSAAFLVKFDSSGIRLWGTYYGGEGSDEGYSCTTDDAENVYLAGWTESSSNIASTGVHQTTYGGLRDAFLVKFDSSGTRLWATYYGGNSNDYGYPSATDASGTVYLAGNTWSTNAIATTGAHQNNFGGGFYDAFLVKFQEIQCDQTDSTITKTSCGSFTLNSIQYSQSGTYTQVLLNGVGCDSIITLNLSITPSPTNLSTNSITSSSANLEWTSPNDPDSFVIRYQKNCTGPYTYKYVSGTARQVTLTNLMGCTDYCFKVRAICTNQTPTSYSASAGYFTTSTSTSCMAVSNVAVSNINGCEYMVSWSNCLTADSFRIRYKLSSATVWSYSNWTSSFSENISLSPGSWMIRVQTKCGTTTYTSLTTNYTVGSCRLANFSYVKFVQQNIMLFPNPTLNKSFLNFNSEIDGDYTISVSDISGQVLNTINGTAVIGENSAEISAEGLPKGIYFIGFKLNNHSQVLKLTVQ